MKRVLLLFPVLVWLTAGEVMAGDREAAPLRVTGQRVMVPIYSHVFMGDRLTPFHVAATASIRNTDPDHPILILAADYHGSQGRKIRSFLSEARRLRPLASLEFNIPESDTTGGYGASF